LRFSGGREGRMFREKAWAWLMCGPLSAGWVVEYGVNPSWDLGRVCSLLCRNGLRLVCNKRRLPGEVAAEDSDENGPRRGPAQSEDKIRKWEGNSSAADDILRRYRQTSCRR